MAQYRTKQVNVRLTELEYKHLTDYREACCQRVSVSEAIRDLAGTVIKHAIVRRRSYTSSHDETCADIYSALVSEYGKPSTDDGTQNK